MFDLNEQINKWRSNLAHSRILDSSDIDELENHLREEIGNLKGSELSDEEIFLIAAYRLGDTASLSYEYAKIDCGKRFKQYVSWMIAGILIYLLATYLASAVSKDCALFAANNGITGYRSLGLIGFGLGILTLVTVFSLCFCVCKLILQIPGLRMQIGQLTTREYSLASLLLILFVIAVYKTAFHVPVPGFKPMSIQQCVEQALGYITFLWSQYLPLILLVLLIYLNKPNPHEEIE